MKNRHAIGRLAGIFCLALATLFVARAWGYTRMGNARMLLMNNDKKFLAAVDTQS